MDISLGGVSPPPVPPLPLPRMVTVFWLVGVVLSSYVVADALITASLPPESNSTSSVLPRWLV